MEESDTMNCSATFLPAAFSAAPRRRGLPVLISSLGLVVAATGLPPIAPAAAQEAAQAEPESGEAGALEDLDLLLKEGEPSAAEAPATERVPTIPVAQEPVAAQAPPPLAKEKRVQLEEIVVTAQKRSEVLSKVPIAISAFDQKSMEKVGTTSLSESTSLVPNLQSSTGGLAIRGIGTTSISSTAPTVAMHVDGIYNDDDARGRTSQWDVERVEVLRGPQGTLYGRNATAGVVNFITAKPSEEFEAFGDVSYRNGNEKLLRLVVNQPVSETLGLRLAASYTQGDGLQKNPVPGETNGGVVDYGLARLAARWTPTDAILWDANVEYTKDDNEPGVAQEDWYASKPNRQTAIVYPSGRSPKEVAPYPPGVEQFGSFAERNRNNADTYSLRSSLRYEFNEQWALTWLTGHSRRDNRFNSHNLPLVQVDHTLRGNDSRLESSVQSHELDLNFEGEAVRGVGGLYYFRKKSREDRILHLWTPSGSAGPESPPQMEQAIDLAEQSFAPNYSQSQAIFGQLTFDVAEQLRLTGGLRYTRDQSELGAGRQIFCPFAEYRDPDDPPSLTCQLLDQSGAFGGIFGPSPLPAAKRDWEALSWKLIADYDITPDLLSYATVSTGYKQGSIASRSARGVEPVEPETNTNYELGLRAQLFDGAANLNLTAFWMNYVDLQVSTSRLVNGAPALALANAAEARIRGIEAELSWQLTEHDRIDSYITYLDAVILSWPNAPDPLRGAAFVFDAAGKHPSGAPEWTFRLGYTRNVDLGSWGTLTPTLSTYYASESYAHYTNGPQDVNAAYWRSDAFLRYDTPERRFSVDLFVNNIEDHQTKAYVFAFLTEATDTEPGGGVQWAFYTPGRIMGLRLGYRF